MYRRKYLGAGLLAILVIAVAMPQAYAVEAEALIPITAENVEYVTGHNAFTGGHVVVQGKRLYVGAYGVGMRIFDINNPASPKPIGEYHPGSDDWNVDTDHVHAVHADAVPDAATYGNMELAVLNGTRRVTSPNNVRTDHTDFFDATDPANLKKLATFIGAADGEAHNGDIVDVRKLWLASGGSGVNGLRIYDLNPLLQTPAAAPTNLFRGDPAELWKASPYYRPPTNRTSEPAFTHTHDMTVYTDYPVEGLGPRDIVLLAEGGTYTNDAGNTGSIFIIDITNPREPVVLLRWFHDIGPGHHPIRYHHEAQFLASDPRVMLVTDEDMHAGAGCTNDAGGVTAVRLSADLRTATELSEWFIPAGTPAPVCSVHVFSTYGNLAFFGSYNAGLQVVDYKDPKNPRRVGQFIAEGTTAWGAQYHKGYVYIGDMTRGLDVVKWLGSKKNNKMKNGSFETSATGLSPDSWTRSGATSYAVGGSDGTRSVTADLLGSWISAPVSVMAGKSYGYSIDVANGGGTLVVEQLDAAGTVRSSVEKMLFAPGDGSFQASVGSFSVANGVSHVRLRLTGPLLGTTTFDNVQLWEE